MKQPNSGLEYGVQLLKNSQHANLIRPAHDVGRGGSRPSRRTDPAHCMCDRCRERGLNRIYCSGCKIVYCPSCWDQQFLHTSVTSATVHERTDIRIYEILRASLRPDRTASEQEDLHRRDERTTWFGVARVRGIEETTFRDYGRFWRIMRESSRRGARNVYPALVSFVGDTGDKRDSLITGAVR